MIRIEDVETAASYYADVFGLHPKWSGDGSIGLGLPETDAEIVLHCDPNIPSSVEVYYLVDDVVAAIAVYFLRERSAPHDGVCFKPLASSCRRLPSSMPRTGKAASVDAGHSGVPSPINTASGQERRAHQQAREAASNPRGVVDR